MIDFKEIYRNNDGVKKDNKYLSNSYLAQIFDETHKNLEKAFYIPDVIQKREELRKWTKCLEGVYRNANRHRDPTPEEWGKYFEDYLDYMEALEEKDGLFFCIDVWTSIKRETELQIYLDDILKEADEKAQNNVYEAICYLIDEKHKLHKEILDEGEADLLLRDEINAIIFDCLQLKINEISNQQPPEPQPFAPVIPKKPFKWNANKKSLGTLFGVLFNHGIMTGNKSDFQKQLITLFEGVPSAGYFNDLINLSVEKTDPNNPAPKYCKETEELLTEWVEFLQSTPIKQK